VSVILDALRRSRKGKETSGSTPPPTAAPRVPAGLGLSSSISTATGLRPGRSRLVGLGALLVIGLGVWAAVQVARTLITNYSPAQSSASVPPGRVIPPAPQPTAPAQTPVPPPPSSVASGAPMTSPASAEARRGKPSAPEREPPATRGNRSERPASSVVLRSAAPQPRAQSPEPRTQSPEPKAQSPEANAQSSEPAAADDVNHFELAVRYHNLGNYEEALKHYLAVLASDEFNVEARNNLGLLFHRRGQTPEAIDQFRRAIAINPQYVRARSNLAVVLMDAGRLAEARAELRAAMTLEPRNADLIVNMALVEKTEQHRDQAIELLVRAIGYQPTHSMAHYNVAVLYEEQSALALAYDHYTEFLKYAGPEHGELLSDVQRRLLMLKPRLSTAAR
jgi:Flp pilus assembly protein TadD